VKGRPGTRSERIFAACAPGLEEVLASELRGLGLETRAVPGGAEAEGADALAVACMGSRIADAVKARLWEGPTDGIPAARRGLARELPGVEVEARTEGGRATLSADASGAPLFKRGWRARVGAAPLRESLAAGLLALAGHDGDRPFLDPMCGSGTLAIEAALVSARRPPGTGRPHAFASWPGADPSRIAAVERRLAARERKAPAPVLASDRNGGAVRLAQRNAATAGVDDVVRVERRDARDVVPPLGPGTCVVNPPYGLRLDREVEASWAALASLVERLPGWTVGVLAGDASLARLLPGRPGSVVPVRNGGLRCSFLLYHR
jgi:putative N6-adenine-specific DNA methylase